MPDQPPAIRADIAVRMLASALDDVSGTLKLYFTLSTGAVVLFINVLIKSAVHKPILMLLALSIFAFAIAAALCLRMLLAMTGPRLLLANALASGEPESELRRKLTDWGNQVKKRGWIMEGLFWLGMASAAAFVIAVVLTR